VSAQEFANQLKRTIQDVKDKGTAAIYCDNLIAYLDEVAKSPSPNPSELELERYRADLQLHIEQSKNYHASQLEMFKSVIASGQSAMRASFLMNGGASVALLAFIGHLSSTDPSKVSAFSAVIIPFVFGVLVMAMTSGFTYLSQWLYHSENLDSQKWGFKINIFSIVLGLSSYVLFLWGMYSAYHAFSNFV